VIGISMVLLYGKERLNERCDFIKKRPSPITVLFPFMPVGLGLGQSRGACISKIPMHKNDRHCGYFVHQARERKLYTNR
jgi:hypothetical protein